MTKQERKAEAERIKSECNTAKDRLIAAEWKLREIGAERAADSLSAIIAKFEAWQNRP